MDKSEAMKRLDAIEAEAKELRRIIEEPKPDYSAWIGKWGVFSDDGPECPFEDKIGKLDGVCEHSNMPFNKKYGASWKYFRPVTAEELGLTVEPDWSKAPEWAMWWARDADGYSFWYDIEPTNDKDCEWWIPENKFQKHTTICQEWRHTLRKRPE